MEQAMPMISPEELANAEAVMESVREAWLGREGVTAIDLGFKWSRGQMTDQLAVRVHVVKKKREVELSAGELFPEEIQGIPVDVIEASYAPQALVSSRPETAIEGRGRRFEVVPIGVSIGCRYSTAGTLGAKVVDSKNGQEMILSNWHVLVGRLNAEPNLSVWQPGWVDGGTNETNTIAKLTRSVLGPYDAAVAQLTGDREVTSRTLEGRPIEDVGEPRLGMQVWKSGRSSGYTEGFIDGIKMTVPLDYGAAGVHVLQKVFRIVPLPGGRYPEISIGGDSGSVWVDEESGKAVGLHFAGEIGDTPEHALAHNIGPVLDALNVRLPAQGNMVKTSPVQSPRPAPLEPVKNGVPVYPSRARYYGDLRARFQYLMRRLVSSE
jgi:endonuclease G